MFNEIPSPEYANAVKQKIYSSPQELQEQTFRHLMANLSKTKFGHDHGISSECNYNDFIQKVPVRDYYDFNKYWELINQDHDSVLWPGKPLALATSSATTGQRKYIPVTQESLSTFYDMLLRVVLQYMYDEQDVSLLEYNIMTFTGSTELAIQNNFSSGSISSVARKLMPSVLSQKSLPSEATLNKMVSLGWDGMFKLAAHEAKDNPISICTGLPSWIMEFFRASCEVFNTKDLKTIYPEMRLLCTSGVNYRPYLPQIKSLFGTRLSIREFYSATEGAFAYQENGFDENMLLNLAGGIYFEFIELDKANVENPPRFGLDNVKVNVPYVPVISTCAGLWAYRMGDIVNFSSTNPYKLSIVGRTAQYISIAAEHVYSQNVEHAMQSMCEELKFEVANFTVAPSRLGDNISDEGTPYYIWYIETPDYMKLDPHQLAFKLDYYLKQNSISYRNLTNGGLISKPKVKFLKPGAFIELLKQKDNSSMQLKVPKVSNDRAIAEFLITTDAIIEPELHA